MTRNRQGILGKADKLLIEIQELSILVNHPRVMEKERKRKLIVKRCDELINLGEVYNVGDIKGWKETCLEDLMGDKEMWEAIQDSHNISQFKKLVGEAQFNELLKV